MFGITVNNIWFSILIIDLVEGGGGGEGEKKN